MANSITKTIVAGGTTSKYLHLIYRIVSDGSQETGTVLYDADVDGNSSTTHGAVMCIQASGKSTAGMVRLEWKQTTNSPIASFMAGYGCEYDFSEFGGVPNPGATGATGDIVITTLSLANLEELTIYLKIRQL